MDHFLKSLLNLLQCCFCFLFGFFGLEVCGILAPPSPSGIEVLPLHWKGKSQALDHQRSPKLGFSMHVFAVHGVAKSRTRPSN